MARDGERATQLAIGVGASTGVIGAGLLAAPTTTGGWVGIRDDLGLRIIGAVDVAVAAGLVAARPRWPWLVTRAAINLPIGAYFVLAGRRAGASAAQALGIGIASAGAFDAAVAKALHAAGR